VKPVLRLVIAVLLLAACGARAQMISCCLPPQTPAQALFRAIENGMSLVRQVEGSLSIAVDPYRRVLAQTDYFGSTDRAMVAQVPVEDVPTLSRRAL